MEYTVQKLARLAGISRGHSDTMMKLDFLSRRESIRQGIEFTARKKLIDCNKFYFIVSLLKPEGY